MKNFIQKLKTFFEINKIQTIKVNFKSLPFLQAIHFPIVVYGKAKFDGLYNGCIVLSEIKPLSVKLGEMRISPWGASYMKFGNNARLYFGKSVHIYRGFTICINQSAKLSFGDFITISPDVFISSSREISIGNNVRIGWNCQLMDCTFHMVYNDNTKTVANPFGKVVLGNNVWLANHVFVNKDSFVPPFSIVASSSLVNKDFSDVTTKGNFFAGSPAKLKTTGIYRLLDCSIEKKLSKSFFTSEESSCSFEEYGDFHSYLNL